MKKMIEFLKNMLLTIVNPDRILNLFKVKNLGQNSNKILENELIVKIMALALTIIFVIAARSEPVIPNTHRQNLENVPVSRIIDEEYTYFGSPIPTVDVILTGDRIQIEMLIAAGGVNAFIDLRDLAVGTHDDVLVHIESVSGQPISSQITVTASPSTVSGIEIDRLGTTEFSLELLGTMPDMDGRYDYNITVYPTDVEVSGPQRLLEEIDAIRVAFDPSNITMESGTTILQAIPVAHDSISHTVTGVEIYPSVVEVQVEIFENLRRIDVEVNESLSNIPSRHIIRSVEANLNQIQVWGDFTDMDSVLELPRIRFTDLDDDGRITIPIPPLLPDGVYSDTTEVEITVSYEVEPPLE